ncbi:MAG: bifunctional riboflavin kinase/FAD synthetase [Paracoccaceae bacterium]
MRTITDSLHVAPAEMGSSAAMGNFDGVHLGHRAVLDLAAARGSLSVVTFEPHPRAHFAPASAPFRLMRPAQRARALREAGARVLFELPFTRALTRLAPDAFVADILHERLRLTAVTVGADFRFGRDRAGDVDALRDLCAGHGIAVQVADLLTAAGTEISSTAIRRALAEARPRDAAAMLGRPHAIEGAVEHGEKRGRTLGYPTANVGLDGLHRPAFGVYAVRAQVRGGPHAGRYDGAASLGVRPQYGGEVPNLETFLFDFSGDLYGATLSVELIEFLRPEATFPSLDAFLAQMAEDCARARAILDA